MSADTDVVREALGFADQPWHREALAALARLEAAFSVAIEVFR